MTAPHTEDFVGVDTSEQQPPRLSGAAFVGRYGALMFLFLIVILASIMRPDTFATTSNVVNILDQSALTAIIAMGLTFVLVTGDFDVSIGYVASLSGMVVTSLINDGWPIPIAILATAVCGMTVGLVNGLIVTVIGVNALVTTLGIGTMVVGLSYAISGGSPIAVTNAEPLLNISFSKFLGIPLPVYLMAVIAVLAWVLLNRTVVGQSMQAVGGNKVAARLAGLWVDGVRVVAFIIAGLTAAICGVLLITQTGSASVTAGDGYLLSAFAAVFFGSAVLRDGKFHIVGTLVGVVTVATGFNAINLIGMPTYWQYLTQGLLLIIGVAISTLARRRHV
jgi:ribose transport system permease protein